MKNFIKKFLTFLLAAMLLLPAINIFADESEILVVSFDEALEMILDDMLVLRDLDIAIRDVEIVHRDLQDVVRRLETGRFQTEMIIELRDALNAVENEIAAANEISNRQMAENMQNIVGADPNMFGETMFTAMISSGAATGQGIMLEMTRAPLRAQIDLWRDHEFVADFRTEMRRNLNHINRQIENLRLNQKIISVNTESVLRGILVGIDELKIGIESMEANLGLAESNIRRMTVAHQVGVFSAHELQSMRHGLLQGQTQLNELKRNLASLYQSLNNLLGLPLDKEVVIEFEREIPEIPEFLDAHIARVIHGAPTIRQLQLDIDFARAQRRAVTENDLDIVITPSQHTRAFGPNADSECEDVIEIRERVALQEAVERAVTAREQAMRAMDSAIRKAYDDLNALVVQEEAQIRNVEHASAALIVADTNLLVGRITQFDVDQAVVAVMTAEQGLKSIKNRKWILGFQLENPILL
jgi:hypothetical protein